MMKLCLYRIPVRRGNSYFETNIEQIIKEIVLQKHADCEVCVNPTSGSQNKISFYRTRFRL